MMRRVDTGYATVWAVGWMSVCLTLAWTVLLLVVDVARQHHLDGAVDLAALSAAAAAQDGDDPCRTAARLAAENAVDLAGCSTHGGDVVVSVTDRLGLPVGITLILTSRARAGPE